MRDRFIASLICTGCLGPAVDDAVDNSRVYGDSQLVAAQLPHVEENPDLVSNVAEFGTDLPYVQAYAGGRRIWYWRVPPPVPDFVVPLYRIVDQDGQPVVDRPIIDVLPGDAGYSPWWRVFTVRTTPAYNGERIWSRAAIDRGVEQGILENPVAQPTVITCPVVTKDTRIQVDADGTTVEPGWAIYRNQRVSWVVFGSSNIEVLPVTERRMPIAPFYTFQRINQPFSLAEPEAGFDLDGNGSLRNTQNIFQIDVGQPGYTPFWYPIHVRTVEDFVSIDTASTADAIEFTQEDDFIGPVYNTIISDRVVPPLDIRRDDLRNCPIQAVRGEL